MRVTGRFEKAGVTGLLRISSPERTAPVFQRVHWVLTVDESGSMDEMCKGGKTKAQLVAHTLKNMLKYFRRLHQEHALEQKLTLIFFDHEQRVYNFGLDGEQSFVDAENQMGSLEGKGLTDLEAALKVANSEICMNKDTDTRTIHIFMTDGLPTSGNCRSADLEELARRYRGSADCGVYTAYLGYGADHDSKLMDGMASVEVDSSSCGMYQFVESHENAGMVYGEAAFNGLYESCTGIKIRLEGAEVYDFVTAKWTNELQSRTNLPCGSEKTWTIRSTGGQVRYNVSGRSWGGESFVETEEAGYIDDEEDSITDHEIRRYDLRQKTMAMVHRCMEYRERVDKEIQKVFTTTGWHQPPPLPLRAGEKRKKRESERDREMQLLRGDIDELIQVIGNLKAMREEDEGGFLGNLVDDLQVAKVGLGSSNGWQYMQMRHTSQGEQRLYNPTDLSELELNEDINLESQAPMSAYKSPGAAVMRECSQL